MVACSHAQADDTTDFDAFCSSQVKSNNCYAPQCIVSCGDKVDCKNDCSGGVSDVCFDDGGMKICTAVDEEGAATSGGDNSGGEQDSMSSGGQRQTFQGSVTISCQDNGQCECDSGNGCSCSPDDSGAMAAGDTCRVTCKGNCQSSSYQCTMGSCHNSNSSGGVNSSLVVAFLAIQGGTVLVLSMLLGLVF